MSNKGRKGRARGHSGMPSGQGPRCVFFRKKADCTRKLYFLEKECVPPTCLFFISSGALGALPECPSPLPGWPWLTVIISFIRGQRFPPAVVALAPAGSVLMSVSASLLWAVLSPGSTMKSWVFFHLSRARLSFLCPLRAQKATDLFGDCLSLYLSRALLLSP